MRRFFPSGARRPVAGSLGHLLPADGPMFDGELAHGEISRIARRESPAQRERGGRYEAVRLGERPPTSGELTAPLSGLPAFGGTQGSGPKPGKDRASGGVLAGPESPNRLLHVDCTDVRCVFRIAERQQTPSRVSATAKEVDEHGRVEENRGQLPNAAVIGAPLVMNPALCVLVPLVTTVGDRADRGLDELPAVVVVKRTLDCARDVRAAAASPDTSVELTHEIIGERNVHTHGHTLTHTPCAGEAATP